MAISNFIPTVWSETLYSELNKNFVAVNHCNRDFEGDIRSKGSVVNICGIGEVSVSDYVKNSDMSAPEELSDSVTKLLIDRAKFFNFQIDDVNKAQASPKLMEAAMQKAAEAIANEADNYVLSLYSDAGKTVCNSSSAEESLYETLLAAREYLYKNNVGDGTEIFFEVSPKVATKILKEKIAIPAISDSAYETGHLGTILGCKIYVCNNVAVSEEEDVLTHHCILRTKRAVSFADQLSEVEAYRPEKRFADAVKGLHLYGAKVVYPNEMICVDVEFNSAEA